MSSPNDKFFRLYFKSGQTGIMVGKDFKDAVECIAAGDGSIPGLVVYTAGTDIHYEFDEAKGWAILDKPLKVVQEISLLPLYPIDQAAFNPDGLTDRYGRKYTFVRSLPVELQKEVHDALTAPGDEEYGISQPGISLNIVGQKLQWGLNEQMFSVFVRTDTIKNMQDIKNYLASFISE